MDPQQVNNLRKALVKAEHGCNQNVIPRSIEWLEGKLGKHDPVAKLISGSFCMDAAQHEVVMMASVGFTFIAREYLRQKLFALEEETANGKTPE